MLGNCGGSVKASCFNMSTTYHRLRSYPSPSDPAVPAAQAGRDSSSCSRHCSRRRSRCVVNGGCRADFGHTSAVAGTHYAAGLVLAGRGHLAIHLSSEPARAAVLVAVAAAAAGLVSLVHRSRV